MKTFRKFRADLDEALEANHDLSVLEFAALSADQIDEDEIAEDGAGPGAGAGAPTNNAGGGNVAGLGVGPQGEPGVSPEYQRKRDQMKLVNGPPVDPRMFSDKIFARKPPTKATVD